MAQTFLTSEECPVCRSPARPYDVVDFNRNCEEKAGVILPLSGMPIYYYHCDGCGFSFAPEIMRWSKKQFKEHIYNDEYGRVDPAYLDERPRANAEAVFKVFGQYFMNARHLDYGGGNGLMSRLMREKGWDSTSYDPFVDVAVQPERLGKFDFITAFEIFEHASDVNKLMQSLTSLMHPRSTVLFSTLISDSDILPNRRLTWWYAAPRNGHISLFSKKSLSLLAESVHLKCGSLNNVTHILYYDRPEWLPVEAEV